MSKKMAMRESGLFLILVFLLPLFFALTIRFNPNLNIIVKTIFFGIEAATPCISAIICVLVFSKWKGLKSFLKEKYYANFNLKKCFMALIFPILIYTLAKLITYLTPYNNAFMGLLTSKKIFILLWALIAEELGWRGYLQERLKVIVGNVLTPILTGIIWALWHYHFFIIGSIDVPYYLFLYGCIAESFGYYLLTKWAKGNIIPASLWHFAGNVFINLYLLNPEWNNGSFIPYLISVFAFTVCIVFYIIMNDKEKNQQN